MFGTLLLIVLLAVAARAFLALRRECPVRREFVGAPRLEAVVLAYPLGPLAMLMGPRVAPQLVVMACVAIMFAVSYILAGNERNALECAGTDRVKGAMEATSLASVGAIVGLIYVGLAAAYWLLVAGVHAHSLGA